MSAAVWALSAQVQHSGQVAGEMGGVMPPTRSTPPAASTASDAAGQPQPLSRFHPGQGVCWPVTCVPANPCNICPSQLTGPALLCVAVARSLEGVSPDEEGCIAPDDQLLTSLEVGLVQKLRQSVQQLAPAAWAQNNLPVPQVGWCGCRQRMHHLISMQFCNQQSRRGPASRMAAQHMCTLVAAAVVALPDSGCLYMVCTFVFAICDAD